MSLLSQPLQSVVALFEGPLSGVRFADIDADGLSKLAAEVEQQEAKLIELRQGLAQRQETLLGLAQQALAYARVYAENDEELLAKLNDISLPRAAKPRKPAAVKARGTNEAEAGASEAAPVESPAEDGAEAAVDADEAEAAPAKTKPAYERPKVKRRLGRAAPQGDSV